MRTGFLYIVLIALVLSPGCHPARRMIIKNKEMSFILDKRWTVTQADSVLSLYGMNAIPYQKLISNNDLGAMADDGWYIKRSTRKTIVLRKPLSNDWAKYDEVNQVLWGTEVETGNTFSKEIFGANIGGENLFEELNDSTTRFFLSGYSDVNRMSISGTFNNWSTQGQPMTKNGNGWFVDVKLQPGRHEYKFINDGKWFYDSANDLKIQDGFYSFNNVYFKPNFRFKYEGIARSVIISGSFNNWNEKDLVMINTNGTHYLDCFLPDGDWQYKFIVDGKWMNDRTNPLTVPNEYNETNSLLKIGDLVEAEVVFYSKEKFNSLKVSGSFNGWDETSFDMIKVNDSTWRFPIQLRPGFYTYRFISLGNWITDMNAPTVPSSIEAQKDNVLIVGANYTFKLKDYPNAKKVFVTGSFIGWSEPGLEMQLVNGIWQLPYFFKPGKVAYKFVVDGEWILDPENPNYEDNEFNTGNSVIWIP